MNSRLFPLRAASLGRLVVISLLLSVLPVLGPEQPAATFAAPANDASQSLAVDKTYSVQWDIDASGRRDDEGGGYRFAQTLKIRIKGSATVHETSAGVVAMPMELKVTDETYFTMTSKCVNDVEQHSIIDPGRYDGGPDPFWNRRGIFRAVQGPGGAWTMANPFARSEPFTHVPTLTRNFAYHYETKFDDLCGTLDRSSSGTGDANTYADVLEPLKDMPLTGDASGSVFTLDGGYDVKVTSVPMTVKVHIKVVVDNCKGVGGPVDISDPRVKMVDLELEDEAMTPDGEATLRALVTCQGVPVINAPVELTMKVKDRSGGHLHSSGNRPRGYIDTMEMGADSKFIGLTEEDGSVSFKIRPGRDLTNKSRGIAGQYLIDALVRWEDLTTPKKQATFDARINGLVPLPPNPDLYVLEPDAFKMHSGDLNGTPAAVGGVTAVAEAWLYEQLTHNTLLIIRHMSPWPVRNLTMYAMSVPAGGLFDEQAWLGPLRMWRPPFGQHRTGVDVYFQPYFYELTPEQRLWYESTFLAVGGRHGSWISDPGTPSWAYTLRLAGAQPHSVATSAPAPDKRASANPDVAASAVLLDARGRRVAGVGQTVTYAVGVENIVSGTVASQVGLKAALPAGLSFISADPAPSRMEDTRTPAWDIGTLAAEAVPKAFRVTARVDPAAVPGTLLIVTATATTGSPDANPTNNQFSDWGLTVQKPGPDLVVGSDLDAVALTAGEPMTFTIRLSNDGNTPAPGSSLILAVPAGINVVKTIPTAGADPNGVRWNAGDLAPGGVVTFTTSLQVAPGVIPEAPAAGEPEYPLPFVMTAASGTPDIDAASNQLQVDKRVEAPGPDLLLALWAEGTPGPGLLEVGKEISYTLHYGNFGNRESSVITGTLGLSPGLALLASEPAPATNELNTTSGVRTLAWNLGKLPVAGERDIVVRLRVDDVPKTGSIVQANVSSKNLDLDPADNAVMETRYKASGPVPGGRKTYLPAVRRP